MFKIESLIKALILTMLFVCGVLNAQPGGWSACPAGSVPNPVGMGCGRQANAICPSSDWLYIDNGTCQYVPTPKAECPAGYEMWIPQSEVGQCWQWVGPSYSNMGESNK
jgi:hypothetical protein